METDDDSLARRKLATWLLMGLSAVVIFLCFQVLSPFFSVFSWALALTVIAAPVQRQVRRVIPNPGAAAIITVLFAATAILLPVSVAVHNLIAEGTAALQSLNIEGDASRLSRWLARLNAKVDLREHLELLLERAAASVTVLLASSLTSVLELVLIFFTVFFLLRDSTAAIAEVRQLMPLSKREATELFERISDTIHATIYGSLAVSFIQGVLGGSMFWLLGLPAPFLAGLVMCLAALTPYLGTMLVWLPMSLYLLFEGDTVRAAVLAIWGTLIVSTIDNLLYPLLIGKRLRFHPLPVFFFIIGGIAFFGASGLVLGPLTLAVADALIVTWKSRLGAPLITQRHEQVTL